MEYSKIQDKDISYFKSILHENVFTDEENKEKYGHDETEDLVFIPGVVLKPSTVEEVSKIMAYCHENNLTITPSGARTGLSGGALPLYNGIALSMEKFNRILTIDEKNHQVVTEPGVITQVLQDAVKEKGLFYPPDPASK